MKAADPALVSFLLSKQPFWTAALFTFQLRDGDLLKFTSTDVPITYGSDTWLPVGPLIQRTRWNAKNTLEVPSLDVTILTTGSDYAEGNLKTLLHQGYFDGCLLNLRRAFMPTMANTVYGTPLLFSGKTGEIKIGSRGAKITFKGLNIRMQQYMPKNRYESGCIHNLYDAGCGADRASFTITNTIGSGSDITNITWGSPPGLDTVYLNNLGLGTLTITSGEDVGTSRTIDSADPFAIHLAYPLLAPPSPGDSISMVYGCDKTRDGTHGCGFFHQISHYRGFRFIPQAEQGL